MIMNWKENIVNNWAKLPNPCRFYGKAWEMFFCNEISKECWDNFTMRCLEYLMIKHKDVLDRLKNV